jgi:hypothetical protein
MDRPSQKTLGSHYAASGSQGQRFFSKLYSVGAGSQGHIRPLVNNQQGATVDGILDTNG